MSDPGAAAIWDGRYLLVPALLSLAAIVVGVALALDQTMRARRRADRSLASLDALLEHAPVGIAFLDRDLRFIRVNDTLAQMDPRTVNQLGRTLDEVYQRPELSALARSVVETGRPVPEIVVAADRDGRVIHAVAGYYPVFGPDGGIDGVGVVVRDVTAAVVAETQRDVLLERVTRLQAITEALAMASTTLDVLRVVVEHVRRAAGAQAGSLCRLTDDEFEVIGSDGYSPTSIARWQRFPLSSPTPMADSIRTGRVVLAGSRAEIAERWPGLGAALGDRGAMAALPLVVEGVAQGAIGLSFEEEQAFGPEEEAFLTAVATQCAEGLLRARLFESERAAHVAAQTSADRLAFLAEASDVLAASLDWERTLQQVAALAVPRLADFAAVFIVDDGRIAATEMAHVDPDRIPSLRAMTERWPADLDQEVGLGAVARTGVPLLANDIRPEQLRAGARDQRHAAAIIAAGFHSLLAVPMRGRDQVIGLIVLATESPRALDETDLALAMELALRAGQAIVNAELFRERSRVAATLQASLLPPVTPSLPGLEVATRFFAVGQGIEVGGDFYDIFPMGTIADPSDKWAVVIGDVRGKGTEAASVSGATRHAIRAVALREQSPRAILAQLNELLLVLAEGDPEPRFCTAVVAAVRPRVDGATVVLAVGGHPPPIILRADGTTEPLTDTGTLIGVLADPVLTDRTIELGPGDSLVLYTDGVTERHEGNRFFDDEGLAAVLSRCTGFTATVLAERIETAARAFVEDAPRDDLAIVVVRVPEAVAAASAATTDLPGDTSAPSHGRRFVLAAIAALRASINTDTAALLASELVTNAVLHGAGPFRISVEGDERRVRVAVTDGSTVLPIMMDEDEQRTSGRGVRLVDTLADDWGVDVLPAGKTVWFELLSPTG